MTGPLRLLRYRFDTLEQVSRHFHLVNGRVVLFYPGLALLKSGEPVLLEVAFLASEHCCEVRGTVMGKEKGGRHAGWWLQFPREVGLAFVDASPAEQRAIVALVREARQRAAGAQEAMHPAHCPCLMRNTVDEPPMPRTAYRQVSAQ
ncbi:MAG TPA: hypothetical protein VLW85_04845 [Myxococcales bacterium]|nr:hypothetical protein [Myxococcales bacterium]